MSKIELHLGTSKLSLTETLKHEMTFKFNTNSIKIIIRLFIYALVISFLKQVSGI